MRKIKVVVFALLLSLILPVFTACTSPKGEGTSYEIECELNGNALSGVERVEFTNPSDNSFNQIKFNLFGNAFRENATFKPIASQYTSRAYPNGQSYGNMQINSVKVEGEGVKYQIAGKDENILVVPLKEELFPDESVVIEIEFTLNLANVIARTGVNDSTINLGNFYPILCGIENNSFYECVYYSSGDPFYSDVSDYDVKITLDKDYVVATSGKLVNASISGNKTTNEYSLKKARSFAMVVSKNFKVLNSDCNGVSVCYYYYDDATPNESLEYATKSLKLFTELYGEYAYPTYSVVQTKFMQGGMEYPALVMIADDLEKNAYGEVIVHETAHQWWQTAVGNNEIKYGFLDEGLAEYSVVAFYERHNEYGMTRKNMVSSAERTYKIFCSVSDKIFGKVNTVMLRELGEFTSEYEYVNMAYIKPCIMYENLRVSVGDSIFFKGLKRYYKEYCFKNARPEDLVGAFEKVGADTNGYFDSFFNGKVII